MTGEWREFAVEGEPVLFWAMLSGPLVADSASLALLKGPRPPSILSSSSSSRTTCSQKLGQGWAIIWKLGKSTRLSCNEATWSAPRRSHVDGACAQDGSRP